MLFSYSFYWLSDQQTCNLVFQSVTGLLLLHELLLLFNHLAEAANHSYKFIVDNAVLVIQLISNTCNLVCQFSLARCTVFLLL